MTAAAVEDVPHVPFGDYLAGEQRSEVRHEWVGGRVFAMAGGSERHALMVGVVGAALLPGALAQGCRPFQQGRRLRVGLATYYPDVMVVCGTAGDDQFETDANVIVDVLSPSTRNIDRPEKAAGYATLPSLRQYLLVDPDRVRIEVAEVAADGLTWSAHGAGMTVFTPYGDLNLDGLYAAVDAVATRQTE